jgi:VWFA-related protein
MRQRLVTKQRFTKFAFLAVLIGLASLAVPHVRGQGQQPAQQPQQTIRAQTALVNVFVTVRDNHNAIITNLTKDDFHIYEDNTEQKVAYFATDVTMPITLGFLVDTSGSETNMLSAIQDTAVAFLTEVMHKGDEAMILSFDTDVDLLADFTDDDAILEKAIRRTKINAPSGNGPFGHLPVTGTAFYDAVYLAAHDQLAGQAGRKAIIVTTDAQDEGSRVKMNDAIEAAQRADAVIHILLVYDPHYGGNSGVAKKMTEETGGRMIDVHSDKTVKQAFDTISEELRHQYVLGYYPTNANRDGTFRKIRVEVTKPGTKILARKGYYAPKD